MKTICLYTISYNGYWEKHGERWCSDINNLNTKPDEIIVASDVPLDLSSLNYENVTNIVSPVVPGRRMVSEYRNIVIKSTLCDWVVSADLDDSYNNIFLDNLPDDSDIHAFRFYDQQEKRFYTPDSSCLHRRLHGSEGSSLVPSHSAIKRHLFDILKYEDNCHEDKVFYAMASQLDLKVSSDKESLPPRFNYSGWHTGDPELDRVSNIYTKNIIDGSAPVYSFWFSEDMSETRSNALKILSESCKTLQLLNSEEFYKFEHPELPIHKGFKYLTDNQKSDYARAYMMYFYGGGYSDVKANEFDWSPYFKKLFSSKYDAVGYGEIKATDIPKFYNAPDVEKYVNDNYKNFIGNGHYIFKPKTYIAYLWITDIHKKMDEKYEDLVKNPGKTTHVLDPNYYNMTKDYPFEWNEIGGRVLAKLQYKNNLENVLPIMPFVNIKNYL